MKTVIAIVIGIAAGAAGVYLYFALALLDAFAN